MIAKIAVLLFVVAAAHATLVGPGIVAPGILNAGLVAPGVAVRAANVWGGPAIAAGPIAWGNGIVSPIGLKGAGIIAAPGVVKTII